jgi:hypothetical protein
MGRKRSRDEEIELARERERGEWCALRALDKHRLTSAPSAVPLRVLFPGWRHLFHFASSCSTGKKRGNGEGAKASWSVVRGDE